jgi:putative Holliday junction resolvase
VRIAGLDVGDKTIGVAVSDELGWLAQGLEVIRRKSLQQDLARLKELARTMGIERWVVGMPRNMNGTYGPRAELTRAFNEQLKAATGLPVEEWDERLSTVAATRTLLEADLSRAKRAKVIDKMAAQVILQSYLDALAIRKRAAAQASEASGEDPNG